MELCFKLILLAVVFDLAMMGGQCAETSGQVYQPNFKKIIRNHYTKNLITQLIKQIESINSKKNLNKEKALSNFLKLQDEILAFDKSDEKQLDMLLELMDALKQKKYHKNSNYMRAGWTSVFNVYSSFNKIWLLLLLLLWKFNKTNSIVSYLNILLFKNII